MPWLSNGYIGEGTEQSWSNTETGQTFTGPQPPKSSPADGMKLVGSIMSEPNGLWGGVYQDAQGKYYGTKAGTNQQGMGQLVPLEGNRPDGQPWTPQNIQAEIAATKVAQDQAAVAQEKNKGITGGGALGDLMAAGFLGGVVMPGVMGSGAAAPGWVSAEGGAGYAGGMAADAAAIGTPSIIAPGIDQIGSDWATQGAVNSAVQTGGLLPSVNGVTLANTAAGSTIPGAVNSGIPSLPASTSIPTAPQATPATPVNSATPVDQVGSDWSAGQATGATGGTLPAVNGVTAANTAAGAAAAGTVASGVGATSTLDKILNGTASAGDLAKIAATVGGGILGATNGAKEAGTTTTVQDLPDWLKPYVQQNLSAAQSYMTANPQNNSLLGPATGQMAKTINGDYLNSNPYLDATFQKAADAVGANIDSRFSKAGRFGSGSLASTLGTNFNNLATDIYGGNYANERARQVAAATAAPDFTTAAATSPFAAFNAFGNLTKQNVSSTTSPYFTNPTAGALSGALAGYGLSKAFG